MHGDGQAHKVSLPSSLGSTEPPTSRPGGVVLPDSTATKLFSPPHPSSASERKVSSSSSSSKYRDKEERRKEDQAPSIEYSGFKPKEDQKLNYRRRKEDSRAWKKENEEEVIAITEKKEDKKFQEGRKPPDRPDSTLPALFGPEVWHQPAPVPEVAAGRMGGDSSTSSSSWDSVGTHGTIGKSLGIRGPQEEGENSFEKSISIGNLLARQSALPRTAVHFVPPLRQRGELYYCGEKTTDRNGLTGTDGDLGSYSQGD